MINLDNGKRLNEGTVASIYRLVDRGMTQREIMVRLGVSRGTIVRYLARRRAENEPPPPSTPSAFTEYRPRELKARGFSVQQIAALLRKPYREVRAAIEAGR